MFKELVAIKVEKINNVNLLKNEAKIYIYLRTIGNFPEVKWFGTYNSHNFLVMNLLGDSLTIFKQNQCKLQLQQVINIGIQFFVDKIRPNVVLGLIDLKHETILNKFMPTSSFPSDHAAITMSIAMMSLFRGIKNKDKKFLRFG